MTEKEAKKQGLVFTGIYENHYSMYNEKQSIKERAAEIRKNYKCRAVLVNEESGVSVYAENKYFELKELEERNLKALTFDTRKQQLYEKYLKELQNLEEEERINLERIQQLKNKYDNID